MERENIRPAPYVGRYKWVLLDRLDAVQWDELRDLIRASYDMVAAKAPVKAGKRRKTSPSERTKRKSGTI